MGVASSISRFTAYLKRHSFGDTIRRAGVELKRALFSSRMVVFYCDLAKQPNAPPRISGSLQLERLTSHSDLRPQDLEEMTSFWNPQQAHRNIQNQFEQGATLWLVKSGDGLAGYGWTIQGRTMSPYYFRLGQDDVQLFDFYVFPKFRGRALHWVLTTYILKTLAAEGRTRAYADTAEWNEAQLSSFKMTPFRRLGMVRTLTIFGRAYVSWVEDEPSAQTPKAAGRKGADSSATARSHEQ